MMPQQQPKLGKRKLPIAKAATPKAPDWSRIRAEWECDLKSTRQIAAQSTAAGRKVSHVAIEKRAKKQGWTRKPVNDEVRSEIQRRLVVTDRVNNAERVNNDAPTAETFDQVIDFAARQGVEVIREHRSHIGRTKRVAEKLLTQLEDATDRADELVVTAARVGEKDVEARARLMRAVGLQGRVSVMKDLVQSVRHLIGLDRTAFNLNDTTAPPDSIEARLAKLEEE